MLSPMMTVLVLAVLWAIVVVPMLVKFWTDRAGERSVAHFGTAMQALTTRRSLGGLARPVSADSHDVRSQTHRSSRPQVFVPGGATRVAPAARRPVPAAMEAVMYPDRVARADLSEARRHMMTRRRRSLTLLIAGTAIGLLWGTAAGGMLAWGTGLAFTAALTGYLFFLRNQALRDRDRRESRQQRSGLNYARGYDATEEFPAYAEPETVVRIDDDDVALHGMADTIDLTGLYQDEQFDERPMRRAV
jgi:hypothetical protein